MNFGKAIGIFHNINSKDFTDEEKGTAIRVVMNMETHNGVKKAAMLEVIKYLWGLCFEFREAEDDKQSRQRSG